MKLSEIIGLKVTEIRYSYTNKNNYDMQEFYSHLNLSNGLIIEIPIYSNFEITESARLNNVFKDAKKINTDCRKRVENQKITDIHFCFYEKEPDDDKKAYLELENGIFLTEKNFGPMGVTNLNLEILTKVEFEKLKEELEKEEEIISFINEINNAY